MLFTLKETTPLPHRIIPSMSAAHSNTRSQLLTRSQRLRGLVIFVHTVKPHLHVLGRAARAHASGGGIRLEGGPSGGSPRELGLGPDVQTQSTVCRARSGVHSSPGAGRWGAEGSRRCCGRAAPLQGLVGGRGRDLALGRRRCVTALFPVILLPAQASLLLWALQALSSAPPASLREERGGGIR